MASAYPGWAAYGSRPPARPPHLGRPAFDVQEALKHEMALERPQGGVDVHEAQKGVVFEERDPRCDSHFEKNRPCPSAVYGVSDQHIVLDSAMARENRSSSGRYGFNIAPQRTGDGHILGVHDTLDTIIQIQVFEFCMPLPLLNDIDASGGDSLTLTPAAGAFNPRADDDPVGGLRSQLAHCPRVTMHIPEISAQSFYDFKGRRHHFEFDAAVDGTLGEPGARLRLTPVNSVFVFTKPLKDLHDLSLQFYGPDEPLRFPPDEFRHGVSLATNGAGVLVVTVPASYEGAAVDLTALLVAGDRIFFDGITSDPAVVAANGEFDSYLNRADGLYVGTTITANTFTTDPTIAVAGVGINTALASSTAITLRIPKHRMRLPMRFRKVVPELTNYIAP